MPGRDGTGPTGGGRMTGRGMGLCAAAERVNNAEYANKGTGGGRGLFCRGGGRGAGRGMGFGIRAGVPAADEKSQLENEISILEKRLSDAKKRASEI